MSVAHILGFPRMGANRELKLFLESFWKGDLSEHQLLAAGRELRAVNWSRQREAGLDLVTVGDFAWYDHVLQTLVYLGGLPARFGFSADALTIAQYFALARGNHAQPAMEMTKWFDTNYHFLVPEWGADTRFDGEGRWLLDEVKEAQALGHPVKVALVGPLTLLHLGKVKGGALDKLDLLPSLLTAYRRLLAKLKDLGVDWVQIDEPILGLELDQRWVQAFPLVYAGLAPAAPKILLATYFEGVSAYAAMIKRLPVAGVHLDLVRGPRQLDEFLEDYPASKVLSLGVVDGRNVWRTDLDAALEVLGCAVRRLGERLWIAASCSLLHVPMDLRQEIKLDDELRGWLAFAMQKLDEIVALKRALIDGPQAVAPAMEASRSTAASRRQSPRIHLEAVQKRALAVTERDAHRASPFGVRIARQRARLKLPPLPTTTIGSFPQTPEIRRARARFKKGEIDRAEYLDAMRAEIGRAVERQEAIGLDVLVHGEAERNDMVEYFGEQLRGFAFTENGWVQSYGSRCVKPPIVYGDVHRLKPMTVEWIAFAQSLTSRPMKGMLTGPVTMLQWSFVRDDQPREQTALQIALALRDEVSDLERAGIAIIQIDEPAFREGLPLQRADWPRYLEWAVRAFKLASCGVADRTQIHTHMCYAEFNDILPAIASLDADVITIETSRSDMELLDAFGDFSYPNEIGPGVYDIHSPRVPSAADMARLLEKAAQVIPWERLWVNPDCGLKTRAWSETEAALRNMIEAARAFRRRIAAPSEAEWGFGHSTDVKLH
jgi:5-methyltetrahydropteroyltriglutamate--homocysteine methyltransferase